MNGITQLVFLTATFIVLTMIFGFPE